MVLDSTWQPTLQITICQAATWHLTCLLLLNTSTRLGHFIVQALQPKQSLEKEGQQGTQTAHSFPLTR